MEEKNNKKRMRSNSEATQNEQEQFADIIFEYTKDSGESNARFPQRKDIGVPAEQDDYTYAFRWDMTDTENADDSKKITKKKKKKGVEHLLCVYIAAMAVSFIIAFSLLSIIFIAERQADLSSISDDNNEGALTDAIGSSEETKTVYVKEFDSTDGVLTPNEIYTVCSPTVVSVSASGDSVNGIGSGFIITSSGYIATAHHVISGMNSITVILHNGDEYAAEVVASDELTDLALLKISASDLCAAEFGKSSQLMVGDELVAIGTPASLEFSGSMTRGDVSFANRKVYIYNEQNGVLKKKMNLIQTTAPLNPGNSGGPVFDIYGKVVGIVTMRMGNDFEGISFIIPSDGASDILYDMMDGTPLSDERRAPIASYAARLGISGEAYVKQNRIGVRVAGFASDEFDAAKKLKIDDVIVSVGSRAVTNSHELSEEIKKYDPGDAVDITVYRSDQLLTFVIILGR